MSRFFSEKYRLLVPYVPGEQPQDRNYVKLNTNESPFPPSPFAQNFARRAAGDLQLYSDPDCKALKSLASEKFGFPEDQIIFTNSSDELLNFAFMAFCDGKTPAAFPDVTYGFYPVFSKLCGVDYTEIPLKNDFTINVNDYTGINKTIFIANPNAPTGLSLPLSDIEKIVSSNRDNVVVIDEAYVDYGTESAIKLVNKYDNLLVCRTFSKSRSLAGARLGFGFACKELISDLETIRYSTNPYNVNRMTMAAGIGALYDEEYFENNCKEIIKTREYTKKELERLGFFVTDSAANFLFASHDKIGGKELYLKLKEKGILIRHFDLPRIENFNRITVGAKEDMAFLIKTLEEIL